MKITRLLNQLTRTTMALSLAASMAPGAYALHKASGDAQPAQSQSTDGTLLVLLKPHSDRVKARQDISNEAQANLINDMHVNREDYSILQVKGSAAQEPTRQKLLNMMKKHPEIASVSVNSTWTSMKKGGGGGGGTAGAPNDPEFSQQWPLSQMRWTAARNSYSTSQKQATHITILSSGTTPVATNSELGAYVTQYNATGSNITKEAVSGGNAEGDVDSSITGCLTNNDTMMAGSGNFVTTLPTYITMLQITTGDSVSTATILNAITWCVNNQAARGGRGPVNLSYGASYPSAPLWSNSSIQSLGQSLLNQGDILVLAAGDTKGTYTKYPPGNVVVVQGTNSKGAFYNQLTNVQGDAAAAPGAVQPAVIGGVYQDDYYGTSFSAPLWCSAIAMLISMNPSLTSAQAHQIVLNTGTPVVNAKWSAVVPAFDKAIQSALAQ